ncbi:protein lin-31-like [Oppia nitens]|uniref:protein lin-31-like n=1 Tax=Oppia nitens TaxID=1686743 RepID=UPI0023DBB854|nr:protein lin-31-like [Oppia nitens]
MYTTTTPSTSTSSATISSPIIIIPTIQSEQINSNNIHNHQHIQSVIKTDHKLCDQSAATAVGGSAAAVASQSSDSGLTIGGGNNTDETNNASSGDQQISCSSGDQKTKPQYSYVALITMAIKSSPDRSLPLAGIYEWIYKRFPYFKKGDKGWQNSIRHNLSLNECFMKIPIEISTTSARKGNKWALHPNYEDMFVDGNYKRRKKIKRNRTSPYDTSKVFMNHHHQQHHHQVVQTVPNMTAYSRNVAAYHHRFDLSTPSLPPGSMISPFPTSSAMAAAAAAAVVAADNQTKHYYQTYNTCQSLNNNNNNNTNTSNNNNTTTSTINDFTTHCWSPLSNLQSQYSCPNTTSLQSYHNTNNNTYNSSTIPSLSSSSTTTSFDSRGVGGRGSTDLLASSVTTGAVGSGGGVLPSLNLDNINVIQQQLRYPY